MKKLITLTALAALLIGCADPVNPSTQSSSYSNQQQSSGSNAGGSSGSNQNQGSFDYETFYDAYNGKGYFKRTYPDRGAYERYDDWLKRQRGSSSQPAAQGGSSSSSNGKSSGGNNTVGNTQSTTQSSSANQRASNPGGTSRYKPFIDYEREYEALNGAGSFQRDFPNRAWFESYENWSSTDNHKNYYEEQYDAIYGPGSFKKQFPNRGSKESRGLWSSRMRSEAQAQQKASNAKPTPVSNAPSGAQAPQKCAVTPAAPTASVGKAPAAQQSSPNKGVGYAEFGLGVSPGSQGPATTPAANTASVGTASK